MLHPLLFSCLSALSGYLNSVVTEIYTFLFLLLLMLWIIIWSFIIFCSACNFVMLCALISFLICLLFFHGLFENGSLPLGPLWIFYYKTNIHLDLFIYQEICRSCSYLILNLVNLNYYYSDPIVYLTDLYTSLAHYLNNLNHEYY